MSSSDEAAAAGTPASRPSPEPAAGRRSAPVNAWLNTTAADAGEPEPEPELDTALNAHAPSWAPGALVATGGTESSDDGAWARALSPNAGGHPAEGVLPSPTAPRAGGVGEVIAVFESRSSGDRTPEARAREDTAFLFSVEAAVHALKMKDLKRRAASFGVTESELDAAEDADDPKATTQQLLLSKLAALKEETPKAIKERVMKELGLGADELDECFDQVDPKEAMLSLMVTAADQPPAGGVAATGPLTEGSSAELEELRQQKRSLLEEKQEGDRRCQELAVELAATKQELEETRTKDLSERAAAQAEELAEAQAALEKVEALLEQATADMKAVGREAKEAAHEAQRKQLMTALRTFDTKKIHKVFQAMEVNWRNEKAYKILLKRHRSLSNRYLQLNAFSAVPTPINICTAKDSPTFCLKMPENA